MTKGIKKMNDNDENCDNSKKKIRWMRMETIIFSRIKSTTPDNNYSKYSDNSTEDLHPHFKQKQRPDVFTPSTTNRWQGHRETVVAQDGPRAACRELPMKEHFSAVDPRITQISACHEFLCFGAGFAFWQ